MPSRLTGILDTYDILGKAIPGVAWFFGILLLLPADLFTIIFGQPTGSDNAFRLGRLATLLLIALVVGLIFGQATDTLARLFERTFAQLRQQFRTIAHVIIRLYGGVAVWFGQAYERLRPDELQIDKSVDLWRLNLDIEWKIEQLQFTRLGSWSPRLKSILVGICAIVPFVGLFVFLNQRIGTPIAILYVVLLLVVTVLLAGYHSRYKTNPSIRSFVRDFSAVQITSEFPRLVPSGLIQSSIQAIFRAVVVSNTALTAHRELFARYIVTRSDVYVSPSDPYQIAYDHLEPIIDETYAFDLDDLGVDENEAQLTDLYPFLRSRLSKQGVTRAAGFQARYSFCRSMWMATLVFTLLYSGIYFTEEIAGSVLSFSTELMTSFLTDTPGLVLTGIFIVVVVALIFELFFRVFLGTVPPFLSWGGGISILLLLSKTPLTDFVQTLLTGVIVSLISWIVGLIITVLTIIGEICIVLFNYSSSDSPLLFELFESSITAIIVILAISSIAFFSATASYKINYIEYLITDTWESFNETQEHALTHAVEITDEDD